MNFSKIFFILYLLVNFVVGEDLSPGAKSAEAAICQVLENIFWLLNMIAAGVMLILWPVGVVLVLVVGFLGKKEINKMLMIVGAWTVACPILLIIFLVLIWIVEFIFTGDKCLTPI